VSSVVARGVAGRKPIVLRARFAARMKAAVSGTMSASAQIGSPPQSQTRPYC